MVGHQKRTIELEWIVAADSTMITSQNDSSKMFATDSITVVDVVESYLELIEARKDELNFFEKGKPQMSLDFSKSGLTLKT
jgi:hypothetical protein